MRRYAEWVIWLCHNHDKIVDKQLRWAVLDRLDSVPTAINHLLQYIRKLQYLWPELLVAERRLPY
jgi:hypothetical protein